MDIRQKLKSQRIYFDGGFGTLLQDKGLKAGELPEIWNISNPQVVTEIHKSYLAAGCDIIKANTFGANCLKFGDEGEFCLENIVSSGLLCAKKAVADFGKEAEKYVAFDIGPLGRFLKPLGDLDFEKAVEIFAKTVKLGVKYGADLILIETMNDCYETKAAVLAAKENSNLPIFVTNAYDDSGKLVTGATPSAMVAMLEGLRVDALGANCSLGPDKLYSVIKEIAENSSTPIIVNPNAGLPKVKDGKTVFECQSEEFADQMVKIANLGVNIMGGCCGTTPEHIRKLKDKTQKLPIVNLGDKAKTVVSSYTHAVEFGKKPILIGERINPTGKPAFKKALRENDFDYILREGIAQQDAGADVLDVNVGLPEIDESSVLLKAVTGLQAVSDLPLTIDTADTKAMESALRVYNGKPLINSVNGKKEVMDEVFPLAAKYGGVIVALTLDENGIPTSALERVEIAQKIIAEASKYGIKKNDIIVDPLAMTVSADNTSAVVTLKTVKMLNELGIKTSLGVSNVSFGLPNRPLVNTSFFTMALNSGLSAAIMNPHSNEMMGAYYTFLMLNNLDPNCSNYIEYASKIESDNTNATINDSVAICDEDRLKKAILKGLKEESATVTGVLIKSKGALDIINQCIIPALDEIGTLFENKKVFLPQLLMSAEAAKSAFDVVKSAIVKSGEKRAKKCKIILATVKGDIHDIGKNIVKVLLENYDYDVIDLGKDVEPELIVETALKEGVTLVGLSALMTTTVPSMEKTIKLLKEKVPNCLTVVGGAVLTKEYADMIGADKYAKDAMETVRYAESLNN